MGRFGYLLESKSLSGTHMHHLRPLSSNSEIFVPENLLEWLPQDLLSLYFVNRCRDTTYKQNNSYMLASVVLV